MAKKKRSDYRVVAFPKMRRFALDAGRLARSRHSVLGLIEVDVTEARNHIREHERKTGQKLSFTAFIIGCLGKAIDSHMSVHAMRDLWGRLVILDEVHVNTMVEIEVDGKKIPIPHIIRAANKRPYLEIHTEIRAAQNKAEQGRELAFMRWFLVLPYFIRRILYWFVIRIPRFSAAYAGTVVLTAVGMFAQGTGWGIGGGSYHPLGAVLGSINEKPGVHAGRIEIREYLHLTLNFDHDVIDGAPMARFTQKFIELIESGYGLID